MKVLFLHGWTSVVGGQKPTYLKEHGHEVINPALPDEDFKESVWIAESEYSKHQPDVIVGSSRGGAVAVNLNSKDTPLVLLCPAWKNWDSANHRWAGSEQKQLVRFSMGNHNTIFRSNLSEYLEAVRSFIELVRKESH